LPESIYYNVYLFCKHCNGGEMKLSTKTRYGLRILMQIAMDSKNGQSVNGRTVSEKQNISELYLEQIMIQLKKAGLVKTERGCRGGYRLNRPPDEINLKEIMELFEGQIELVRCKNKGENCNRFEDCQARKAWRRLSETLKNEASKITLSSLLKK